MKLSQMREELIAEHAELRRLASHVATEAEHVLEGEGATTEGLRSLLGRFDAALQAHNRHEERLLRDEIRHVDAWGPLREALMDEVHEAEHSSIVQALGDTHASADAREIAAQGLAVVRRVLEHIEAEERELLHPDVLRDDLVTIQGASE